MSEGETFDAYVQRCDAFALSKLTVLNHVADAVDLRYAVVGILGEVNAFMSDYVRLKVDQAVNARMTAMIFLVHSPGGQVDECRRIMAQMDRLRKVHEMKLITCVVGMAASCAQIITSYSSHGDFGFKEGVSVLEPACNMLTHQVSTSGLGNMMVKKEALSTYALDTAETNDEFFQTMDERVKTPISGIVKELVKMPDFQNDHFLKVDQALALRLADRKGFVFAVVTKDAVPAHPLVFPVCKKGQVSVYLDARKTETFNHEAWKAQVHANHINEQIRHAERAQKRLERRGELYHQLHVAGKAVDNTVGIVTEEFTRVKI